jgi:hypothetical protein
LILGGKGFAFRRGGCSFLFLVCERDRNEEL